MISYYLARVLYISSVFLLIVFGSGELICEPADTNAQLQVTQLSL